MAKVRCPVHDTVVDARSNQSNPGEGENLEQGFGQGHADCPQCKLDKNGRKPITRAQVQEIATKNGVSFDTAAQQAVAQGFEVSA